MGKIIIQENYYSKLQDLFNNKLNKLYLIIAPPRSGSTLLEKVLSGSKNISEDIHEPFMEFGRREGNINEAYQKICNLLNKSPNKSKNILIKEMSQDIIRKNVFKKLLCLTNKIIILNIRDPFLCAESRIKAMLRASPIALKDPTKKFILNKLKKRMEKYEFNEIYNKYLKNDSTEFNRKLLDAYAKIMNYVCWEDYVNNFIEMRDYREFEDFLFSDKERFMMGFGWEEISIIEKYLENKKMTLLIIDSTDFRTNPKKYAKQICKLWGIKYKKDMLTWKKGAYKHVGEVWYSSINDSSFVKSHIETSITIDKFPVAVQEYLKKIAIPIYKRLYSKRLKDENKKLQI